MTASKELLTGTTEVMMQGYAAVSTISGDIAENTTINDKFQPISDGGVAQTITQTQSLERSSEIKTIQEDVSLSRTPPATAENKPKISTGHKILKGIRTGIKCITFPIWYPLPRVKSVAKGIGTLATLAGNAIFLLSSVPLESTSKVTKVLTAPLWGLGFALGGLLSGVGIDFGAIGKITGGIANFLGNLKG